MKAYRFHLPLKQPLKLKGRMYQYREGVLIEHNGHWAEASPLPGFSVETIDQVIAALRGEQEAPASLDFAWSMLQSPIDLPVAVSFNRLLIGEPSQVLAGAEACADCGCRAVKLKVGRNEIGADAELVRGVREQLSAEVGLRLDANQAWSLEEALRFLKSVADVDIEYIEEPLRDPTGLEELYTRTQVKYALDETLREALRQQHFLEAWPNVTALICKPTVLGGRDVVERLVASGKPVVFSAAFESGVGIARVMQLAAEYSPALPAGLDTLDWLADNLLQHPIPKQDGYLTIDSLEVKTSELDPIAL